MLLRHLIPFLGQWTRNHIYRFNINVGHHISYNCSWYVYHQWTIHGIHRNHGLSCMSCSTCMHGINISKGMQSCHESGDLCLVKSSYFTMHVWNSSSVSFKNNDIDKQKIRKNDANEHIRKKWNCISKELPHNVAATSDSLSWSVNKKSYLQIQYQCRAPHLL